ncbi:hypothetical protein KGM_206649 [Danaus plexippus plexippus]|uniref:Uncharacterized protein n=1 Tax=Danaus plexippus plexippus TaxID=278856 RepID=A0A212FC90_DANPL|nr:hypothetical protein KGM_206649 [Danaus plexippus plexippus]
MKSYGCNLECVDDKKTEKVVEFVGPVKIVLVDQPKNSYRHKTWAAAFITLAQMLMAVTTIFVIFYTLTFKKREYLKALHVFLCTVGFQLVMPTGVLILNDLTGASAPMSFVDRRFEHGMLQIFSSGLVAGAAATVLALLNAAIGITAYLIGLIISKSKIRIIIIIHRLIGIPAIIASSACFISGVINVSFREWVPTVEMFYALLIFCTIYTIIVIYQPFRNI